MSEWPPVTLSRRHTPAACHLGPGPTQPVVRTGQISTLPGPCGEGGGNWTGGFFRQILRAPLLSLFTGQKLRPLVSKERREDLQHLAELIEAGTLTPVVGKTYPLAEAPDAIRYLEGGHARGKVVISVVGTRP